MQTQMLHPDANTALCSSKRPKKVGKGSNLSIYFISLKILQLLA